MFKNISVFWMLLLALNAQGQQSFTMQEAVTYARQNANDTKVAMIDIAMAEAQIKEVLAIGLPQVSAQFRYNFNPDIQPVLLPARAFGNPNAGEGDFLVARFGTRQGMSLGINASQLLFDGTYIVGLKASRALKDQSILAAAIPQQTIAINVSKLYVGVLSARSSANTLRNNIKNLENMERQMQETYKNGFIEQLDVDRITLSLSNLKNTLATVERMEEGVKNSMKMVMGYPINEPIELTEKLESLQSLSADADMSSAPDFAKRPEYNLLKKAQELQGYNVQRFKMGYYPSVAAFGSYTFQIQRDDLFKDNGSGLLRSSVVGIQANIPIFDGFDKKSKIAKAKLDQDKVGLQLSLFERGMQLEVANARIAYDNAQKNLSATRQTMALAQRIYNTTQTKFKEGIGSSLEIVNAERELYAAQSNELTAIFDLLNAKLDLDKALGNLAK